MKQCWILNKPVTPLSVCHLDLCLGWQFCSILLLGQCTVRSRQDLKELISLAEDGTQRSKRRRSGCRCAMYSCYYRGRMQSTKKKSVNVLHGTSLGVARGVTLLWHKVVLIQAIVFHDCLSLSFYLSLFRVVVVVLVPCCATCEQHLDLVYGVSERRTRGGGAVPAWLHNLVIPINKIRRMQRD